jgi:alkylation response protein AidB-like acyl-CoA dehydrogenase
MSVTAELDDALLRSSARGFLARRHPVNKLRSAIDSNEGIDRSAWMAVAELGWPGLLVPESRGGGGGTWMEAALLSEESGRALYPYPIAASMVLAGLVAALPEHPVTDVALAQLLDGSSVVGWGIAELAIGWSASDTAVVVHERDGALLADGQKWFVEGGDSASALIVHARDGRDLVLAVLDVPSPGLTVTRSRTIDPSRHLCHVQLDAVAVDRSSMFTIDVEQVQHALDGAALLFAADAAGACGRLVEMTVDYAEQRIAFGRRIAEYQVIKHRCADMCSWAETIGAAVRAAAHALDRQDPMSSRLVSAAKLLAGDLGVRVGGEALQIHAGIGFTWDHDLHLYLRRLHADATLFGEGAVHADRVVAALYAELSS